MERIALVIVAVWVLLCGAGYVLRVACGVGRHTACVGVGALYVACGLFSLLFFGLNATGGLGAAGMAVPCLATIAGIVLSR